MTFITSNLKGGIGNQLFQIACGISLAKKHNCNFVIDKAHIGNRGQGSHPEKYYDNLFERIMVYDSTYTSENTFYYKEQEFAWQNLDPVVSDALQKWSQKIVLEGYFQSEKYFSEFGSYIYDVFTPPEGLREWVKKETNLFLRFPELDPYKVGLVTSRCLVGVRRGDYLALNSYYTICDLNYYKKAFEVVPVDIYYVISDDIDWCKKEFVKEFPTKRFVFLEESDDLITFSFARLFRNYICANSSFHWWASYLSYYKGLGEDVKVVCPKKHFGPSGPQDYADYFRKDMILL
jgi:hypothetical protein